MKNLIGYGDFAELDLKIGRVMGAEKVAGSDKLLKLTANLGNDQRQIIAGIGRRYEPETIVGRQIVILVNLEPKKIMGLKSEGMLLAAEDKTGPIVLTPAAETKDGASIR